MNTAPSPPEMENKAPEEGSTGLGTSTPPGEADEPGRNVTTDKRDGRERVPTSGPPQPKLNGGQQPPAGVPTHFDPAFRSMMPPYVRYKLQYHSEQSALVCQTMFSFCCHDDYGFCVFRCSMPIHRWLLDQGKETSDTPYHKMEQSEFMS